MGSERKNIRPITWADAKEACETIAYCLREGEYADALKMTGLVLFIFFLTVCVPVGVLWVGTSVYAALGNECGAHEVERMFVAFGTMYVFLDYVNTVWWGK